VSANVTLEHKRYVFVCVGCRRLACSERSDAITCSTACRVRAHRNGSAKRLRDIADALDVRPGLVQQAAAIKALTPEIDAEIQAGKRRIDDEVRRAVWEAFRERVRQVIEATPHEPGEPTQSPPF
jgi:hypothetical protein